MPSLLVATASLILSAELPLEAPIVPEAVPLEETGRYRSSRSYDETVDYYKRVFRRTGGVRWYNIVNKPGIKARHIKSLRKKTRWEGINISEHRGQVRIFVIQRDEPPPKQGKRKRRGGKK
ncbi:MAG: hypothetical protein V3T05_04225 [Myxococcota bacterium]